MNLRASSVQVEGVPNNLGFIGSSVLHDRKWAESIGSSQVAIAVTGSAAENEPMVVDIQNALYTTLGTE